MSRLGNRKARNSARPEDITVFVAQVSKDLHRAPSLNEIAFHLGVSKTEAERKVRELIRQGILERGAAPLSRAKGIPGIRVRIKSRKGQAR